MAYVRGHRTDFDDWAAAGNAGWSYDEMLPYFKRAEGNRVHGGPLHGRDGPLSAEDVRSDNAFTQRFIDASRAGRRAVQSGHQWRIAGRRMSLPGHAAPRRAPTCTPPRGATTCS